MTYITTADLPAWFTRTVIGGASLLDSAVGSSKFQNPNYPPMDQIQVSENVYKLVFAVAGFKKNELVVSVDGKTLTVATNCQSKDGEVELPYGEVETAETYPKFIHKGIAKREFSKTFQLVDYIVVKDSTLSDGLLTVTLERQLPDELKPRTIEIL